MAERMDSMFVLNDDDGCVRNGIRGGKGVGPREREIGVEQDLGIPYDHTRFHHHSGCLFLVLLDIIFIFIIIFVRLRLRIIGTLVQLPIFLGEETVGYQGELPHSQGRVCHGRPVESVVATSYRRIGSRSIVARRGERKGRCLQAGRLGCKRVDRIVTSERWHPGPARCRRVVQSESISSPWLLAAVDRSMEQGASVTLTHTSTHDRWL